MTGTSLTHVARGADAVRAARSRACRQSTQELHCAMVANAGTDAAVRRAAADRSRSFAISHAAHSNTVPAAGCDLVTGNRDRTACVPAGAARVIRKDTAS